MRFLYRTYSFAFPYVFLPSFLSFFPPPPVSIISSLDRLIPFYYLLPPSLLPTSTLHSIFSLSVIFSLHLFASLHHIIPPSLSIRFFSSSLFHSILPLFPLFLCLCFSFSLSSYPLFLSQTFHNSLTCLYSFSFSPFLPSFLYSTSVSIPRSSLLVFLPHLSFPLRQFTPRFSPS